MSFKVQKIRKKAELFLADGSNMAGNFFVSPQTPNHAGSESISDLLTNERIYIPFELNDGDVVLVQKESIVMILLKESELNKDLPYLKSSRVTVLLLSGETLEGEVYLDLPQSRSRLSDFLNYSKEFFYLEVENQDYLVNSRFVKIVQPAMSE